METVAKYITTGISHSLEILAAVAIVIALLQVIGKYLRMFKADLEQKEHIRIQFGSSVAIALELLLGADVLSTAVAPSWDDIGKLAAIAALRTVLNYFLDKELQAATNRA